MSKVSKLVRIMCCLLAVLMLVSCSNTNEASSSVASSSEDSKGESKVESKKTSSGLSADDYNNPTEYEVYEGERDPWLWPFSRNSIWNMPIGSNAEYVDTGFVMTKNYSVDVERHLKTTSDDPVLTIVTFKNGRWSDNEEDISKFGETMYFPADVLIPNSRGNSCTAVLQPDGRTLIQLQPACRENTESKYISGYPRMNVDLYSDGYYGTHWGSGLSSFGGTIRLGEMVSDEDIHHALKINIWAAQYLYLGVSYDGLGNFCYNWPADRCDSYAALGGSNGYGGTNPYLMMGSLLAIPPEVTEEGLGLTTEPAKKLFRALQNYGAYIADDVYWDCFSWSIEDGVDDEMMKKYGVSLTGQLGNEPSDNQRKYSADMEKLFLSLKIVKNNTKDSIGGGGTPRVPLAPDLPVIDR